MTLISIPVAGTLILLGALVLYLASPHEALLATPVRRKAPISLAVLGLLAAQAVLVRHFGTATSAFVLMTALMLLWTVPPVVIAWFRHRKKQSR